MSSPAGATARFAGNPASAVYGTILVAGQLAVESATSHSTGQIVGSLAATVVVFWLAHAYTDTLGSAIVEGTGRPPSFRHALRTEWPIVESALIPGIALLVFVAAGAGPSTAAVAALVTANVELVGWALLAARRAGLTGLRRVGAAVVGGAFGIALIALKYLIH